MVETFAASAVKVAFCVTPTDNTFAVKVPIVAFAGTVSVAGTVTAVSLLERVTLNPPLGAAALSVTVQESVPEPVMEALAQETVPNAAPEFAGDPVPAEPVPVTVPVSLGFTRWNPLQADIATTRMLDRMNRGIIRKGLAREKRLPFCMGCCHGLLARLHEKASRGANSSLDGGRLRTPCIPSPRRALSRFGLFRTSLPFLRRLSNKLSIRPRVASYPFNVRLGNFRVILFNINGIFHL